MAILTTGLRGCENCRVTRVSKLLKKRENLCELDFRPGDIMEITLCPFHEVAMMTTKTYNFYTDIAMTKNTFLLQTCCWRGAACIARCTSSSEVGVSRRLRAYYNLLR